MFLKLWRFVTIFLTAMLATLTCSHFWQLPTRMAYDRQFWFGTLDLYAQLGPAGPGPAIEVGAIVAAVILVFLSRKRQPAFPLSIVAALTLIASFAAWWWLVRPVNLEMATWTAGTIPADWTSYREQWEYTHAARALASLFALAMLVWSVVDEAPDDIEDSLALVARGDLSHRPVKQA